MPCVRATRWRVCVLAALLAGVHGSAQAQLIGTEPSQSPFRDLPMNQQLTLFTGWMDATKDAAGIGPKPAPVFGIRHDIHLGGVAWLTSRYTMLSSERQVLDPGLPAAERDQGTQSATHHIADVGFSLALTGKKTWRGLLPTIGTGVGVVSDFSDSDIGGYRFGTKFALTFGPGLRVMLPRGYSARFDITNTLHQFQYPETYFTAASDGTRVLEDTRQRSGWRSNWNFTAGLSTPIFR